MKGIFLRILKQTVRSETTTESGLAAANEYFKAEQVRLEGKIAKLKDEKSELEQTIEQKEQDKRELLEQVRSIILRSDLSHFCTKKAHWVPFLLFLRWKNKWMIMNNLVKNVRL